MVSGSVLNCVSNVSRFRRVCVCVPTQSTGRTLHRARCTQEGEFGTLAAGRCTAPESMVQHLLQPRFLECCIPLPDKGLDGWKVCLTRRMSGVRVPHRPPPSLPCHTMTNSVNTRQNRRLCAACLYDCTSSKRRDEKRTPSTAIRVHPRSLADPLFPSANTRQCTRMGGRISITQRCLLLVSPRAGNSICQLHRQPAGAQGPCKSSSATWPCMTTTSSAGLRSRSLAFIRGSPSSPSAASPSPGQRERAHASA